MTDPLCVDLHSHWLLNGHYLRRRLERLRPDPLALGPLGNRFGLEMALEGHVHGVAFTAYSPLLSGALALQDLRAQFRTLRRAAAASEGRLRLVRTGKEVREARRDGVVGGFLAVEGGACLARGIPALEELATEGVRMVTLVHFVPNALGDPGEFPVHPHRGLSPLGRRLVPEMGRRGILPDVAHLCDEGVRQVLDLAEGPVVCSHTGMRALCDRPRNLPDDLARGIARTGGLVGILWFPPYLARNPRGVGLDRVVDHMRHAASVAGPDHVAVGTDLDGWTWPPRGLEGHHRLPALAEALARAGFSDAEVQGILGGNALRVIGDGD
ncbi:MAG TPA: membrane dipeptidase [Myxococcota bacterium]|nr:membrane dipeptidase [Myxococcota bacterium]HQK49885.1 membrane dipeptidase [Myxococcota bacterium]